MKERMFFLIRFASWLRLYYDCANHIAKDSSKGGQDITWENCFGTKRSINNDRMLHERL
jgi:hypothetical protein